ncbi:hypothetical protein IG631_01042 [Alternaria alternata]|nr:hypothetical protein IG631_01042 [Alternaria alternata]
MSLSDVGIASGFDSVLGCSSSLGIPESTFCGTFFAARFSSELSPCRRLLSALQPLRENHLSANLPYTPFRCMTSSATLVFWAAVPFCPVTVSFTSLGADEESSTIESVTLGAPSSLSLSVSSSSSPGARLRRFKWSRVATMALSASACEESGMRATLVIL